MTETAALAEPSVAEPEIVNTAPIRRAVLLPRVATALAILAYLEIAGVALIAGIGDARFQVEPNLPSIGFVASVALFPTFGALIIQRRPRTRVAWLMIVIGLAFGLGLVSFGYGSVGAPPAAPLPAAAELLVLAQLFFVPIPAPTFAFLLLLFPADRMLSERWRLVGLVAVVGGALYAVGILLSQGAIDPAMFPATTNPFGAPSSWSSLLDAMTVAGNAIVTGAILLAALSLVVRYRRADATESAQIRWIALVGGLAAVVLAVSALQIDDGPLAGVSELAFGAGLIILAGTPIAIGIAITRYRLYDIDRLINRTLVYGSLSAILAGIFTAAVGLAQRVFVATTGQSSDAAIVLTTLVVATLYAPLRKRLEAIVDRHFKYDERRFGAYRNEITQILSVVEPARAAGRLATEAVAELAATGGAVLDSHDEPTATAGVWPGPSTVRLPIPGGDPTMAALVVGPRLDGSPYDPRSIAELAEVVALAAAAVRPRSVNDRPAAPTP